MKSDLDSVGKHVEMPKIESGELMWQRGLKGHLPSTLQFPILPPFGSLLQKGNGKKKEKKEEAFPRHPVVQQLPINSTSVPPPPPWGDDSPSGSRRTNIRRRCCCCCRHLFFPGRKPKGPAHFSSQSYFLSRQTTVSEADQRRRPVPLISGGEDWWGGRVDGSPLFLRDRFLLILCRWVTKWNARFPRATTLGCRPPVFLSSHPLY